jgi:hypothetical protein
MTQALLFATTVSAVTAIVALLLLVYVGWDQRKSPYWYPMTFWVLHSAIFYTTNVIARLVVGYSMPTAFFSLWGTVVFLQAFVSIGAVTVVKLRMDR